MKGTTGQKQRPKQTQKWKPGARAESPNYDHPRWRPVSILFQSKRCAKIWHDKTKREWNNSNLEFNCRTCRGFWRPVIPFQLNALGKKLGKKIILHRSSFSPETQLTYLSQSVVKFHRVIWTIPRNNKYMKKPQNLITLDFCLEHGSRTNKKENQQHKM